MNSDDKIYKGTIIRMMDQKPRKVVEDTTAHGKVIMIRVNENYDEIPGEKEYSYFLFLDEIYGEGEDYQSILYNPFLEKEKEFLNREPISRFEIMEL